MEISFGILFRMQTTEERSVAAHHVLTPSGKSETQIAPRQLQNIDEGRPTPDGPLELPPLRSVVPVSSPPHDIAVDRDRDVFPEGTRGTLLDIFI